MVRGASGEDSVYLLSGEEPFLKDEFIHSTKKRLLEESNKELNFSAFSSRDPVVEDALSVARTAPFVGKKRVVLLREVDRLDEKGKAALLTYLKKPALTTCLILESSKASGANTFLRDVSGYASVVRVSPLRYGALDSWIRQRARLYGKQIAKEAVALLKSLAGNDLSSLANELEKISSFAEGRPIITAGDVEAVTGRSIKEDVFILVSYINERDVSRALLLCKRLLRQGKRVPDIIGLMGWNFRRFLLTSGRDTPGSDEIKKKLKLLFEADRAIKTGSSKPEFALDMLISRLCVTEPGRSF